jgi:hypothetical protein
MIELTHSEKQFVLYTKGHFIKSDNKIDDINKIVAKAFALPENDVGLYSVIHFVAQLFDRLIQSGYIPTEGKSPLKYMLDYIYKDNLQRDDESLFNFMFYSIQNTEVGGMNLGEADSTYLQLVNKKVG